MSRNRHDLPQGHPRIIEMGGQRFTSGEASPTPKGMGTHPFKPQQVAGPTPSLTPPNLLKPLGIQLGISNRVLNIAMAQPVLNQSSV